MAALGAATLVGLAGASPAAADPPEPTDYRSTIESVEPALDGAEVEVVGGDSFLELRVDEGHEALVPGYGGEPYLRFRTDGTVERNANSPATYLNEDRLGDTEIPGTATPEAEPDWERVAGGGTYAWHDHRIHWMSDQSPPGKGPGDVIQEWEVDITVDGTTSTVSGRLTWEESVPAWPWALLAVLAGGAVVVLARQVAPAGSVAALVAATVATVVGWGQWADAPPGSGASVLVVAVPAAGLVAAVVGLVLRGRSPGAARATTLAAVAAVLGWAALRLPVLWKPVISTVLPDGLDRAGTALAGGLAVGAAVAVVLAMDLTVRPEPQPAPEPQT